MRFLFVTAARLDRSPAGDHSTRYRAFHLVEALRARGHRAAVAMLHELDARTLAAHDVVSVLRPSATRRLARLLGSPRRRSFLALADVDDLIVDPELAALSPKVVNGFASEARVRGYFAAHRDALDLVDAVTVSTAPIAEAVRRVRPALPVALVRNGLSATWLRACPTADSPQRDTFRLVYLPGTRSHDRDFGSVEAALARFVAASPRRRLRLVGEVACSAGLFPAGRLERVPRVDYFSLPGLLADSDVSIAPLVPNAFNHAKSRIKFTESAALGTPLVASPLGDFAGHEGPGLHLVESGEAWLEALETLEATPPSQARRTRRALREHVRACATADLAADALLGFCATRLARPPEALARAG